MSWGFWLCGTDCGKFGVRAGSELCCTGAVCTGKFWTDATGTRNWPLTIWTPILCVPGLNLWIRLIFVNDYGIFYLWFGLCNCSGWTVIVWSPGGGRIWFIGTTEFLAVKSSRDYPRLTVLSVCWNWWLTRHRCRDWLGHGGHNSGCTRLRDDIWGHYSRIIDNSHRYYLTLWWWSIHWTLYSWPWVWRWHQILEIIQNFYILIKIYTYGWLLNSRLLDTGNWVHSDWLNGRLSWILSILGILLQ